MYDYIKMIIHHNVPRFIEHVLKRGGVHENEWEWLQNKSEDVHYLSGILARADDYLMFPKNEKIHYQGIFVLVKSLSIMAFIPGGVRFLGLHFSSEIENFVLVEDDYGCS